MAALLSACGARSEQGRIEFVEEFFGGAVADEPRAALIARDILTSGGSAADAAIALYFAMGVTLPSSAGLGGGGVCIVHDPVKKRTEALDFFPRGPSAPGRSVGRSREQAAVPGSMSGMFALHARLGRLRWEQLVFPAERLAQFGNPVSRSLAREIARGKERLFADRQSRKIFARVDGEALREGDDLRQLDLAGFLSRIRVMGPGEFYLGALGRQFVAAVNQDGANKDGAGLSMEHLRSYRPVWRKTLTGRVGNHMIHFAPPPAYGGFVAATMWTILADRGRYSSAGSDLRPHLLAEASERSFADAVARLATGRGFAAPSDPKTWRGHAAKLMNGYREDRHTNSAAAGGTPYSNPAVASFVVMDKDGGAVACAVTMNRLFGTGRVLPSLGIIPAAAPVWGGLERLALAPVLVSNRITGDTFFAGASSGGSGPTAMVSVALKALVDRWPLDRALAATRIHHGGVPDAVFVEHGAADRTLEALAKRGHRIVQVTAIGRVNAIHCPDGARRSPDLCQIFADRRGYGLATFADR